MSLNTEQFMEHARQLTEQRMAAAEEIATAISKRLDAEKALKEAEKAETAAYQKAEKQGWSKAELNKLKPTKRRRSAPQKKQSTTPSSQAATLPEHTEPSTPPGNLKPTGV